MDKLANQILFDNATINKLNKFIHAQDNGYEHGSTFATALNEINTNRKTSHWIWYIIPYNIANPNESNITKEFKLGDTNPNADNPEIAAYLLYQQNKYQLFNNYYKIITAIYNKLSKLPNPFILADIEKIIGSGKYGDQYKLKNSLQNFLPVIEKYKTVLEPQLTQTAIEAKRNSRETDQMDEFIQRINKILDAFKVKVIKPVNAGLDKADKASVEKPVNADNPTTDTAASKTSYMKFLAIIPVIGLLTITYFLVSNKTKQNHKHKKKSSRNMVGGANKPKSSTKPLTYIANGFTDKELIDIQQILDHKKSWNVPFRLIRSLGQAPDQPDIIIYKLARKKIDKIFHKYPHLHGLSVTDRSSQPIKIYFQEENWNTVPAKSGYGDDLASYRTYLILHEFGHALGHNHAKCTGDNKPSPVMMQQTKGTGECYPDPWPVKD